MLDGALPYVDIWDRKPIGLFLIYLPPQRSARVLGLWIYQIMALASVVLTALLILRLAGHAGWQKGGLVAALLYILMLGFGDGQSGQAPVFYNLITAFAMLLALPCAASADSERLRKGKAIAAMALIGVALQVKYSVLFEGMFLGLWLLWRERRLGYPRSIVRFGAVLVAWRWCRPCSPGAPISRSGMAMRGSTPISDRSSPATAIRRWFWSAPSSRSH
jgi:hypothetical protein